MSIPTHQAIILAAGRGSRMGPLTVDQPKCLTVLAGRRLLDWQMAALTAAGIKAITVVGGYRIDLLRFGNHELIDNPDWPTTNMVATLRCASEHLHTAPAIVSYSDIVYRSDHVRRLAEAPGELAITYDQQWRALWETRFDNPLADAETFRQRGGWLETIGERATDLSAIEGQYMGLIRFTPEGWRKAEDWLNAQSAEYQRRIDMTSFLRGLLAAGIPVACVPVSGGWCEVDSGEDAQRYEAQLHHLPGRWSHDWREEGALLSPALNPVDTT
jgi:choline kinase